MVVGPSFPTVLSYVITRWLFIFLGDKVRCSASILKCLSKPFLKGFALHGKGLDL